MDWNKISVFFLSTSFIDKSLTWYDMLFACLIRNVFYLWVFCFNLWQYFFHHLPDNSLLIFTFLYSPMYIFYSICKSFLISPVILGMPSNFGTGNVTMMPWAVPTHSNPWQMSKLVTQIAFWPAEWKRITKIFGNSKEFWSKCNELKACRNLAHATMTA